MLKRFLSNLKRDEKGQDYVEFAVIVPIMMLMLMGIVDFGRVFNTWLLVTHGAREGARWAAVGHSDADITAHVTATMGSVPIDPPQIDPPPADRAAGQPVTVTVHTSVELFSALIANMFAANPYPLDNSAVMRYEGDAITPP